MVLLARPSRSTTKERTTIPADLKGSVYTTSTGYGIRWAEDGRRRQSGFATKTQARRWFADTVAPRLRAGGPSPRARRRRCASG